MTIRWITPLLGTAPALPVVGDPAVCLIDVRDLVDKAGNRAEPVGEKIREGCESLRAGRTTIVGCDYGISRSNAIAAGILARVEGLPLETAVRRVMAATGETDMKLGPLQAVRIALGESAPRPAPAGPRVVVTGATGFLGAPIAKRLATQFEVVAPQRAELELHRGGILLDLIAAESGADCIVHCASPRVYTSNVAMGASLTMLRNVLDVCASRDLRLVYLSSWEVYSGYRTACLHADERLPLLPKGPYGETKYLGEILIEHARAAEGLRCAMLRSSPVYGEGSDKPKFIYNLLDRIRRSEPVVTHEYRNCRPALDLLHLDDLVAAVAQVVGSGALGTFNVGTGVLTSTRDVAELLMRLLGRQSEIRTVAVDADVACIAMDSGRAAAVLGWRAGVGLEQGLARLVEQTAR